MFRIPLLLVLVCTVSCANDDAANDGEGGQGGVTAQEGGSGGMATGGAGGGINGSGGNAPAASGGSSVAGSGGKQGDAGIVAMLDAASDASDERTS